MMSKTHLTVGMADALAFTSINTPAECAIAIAGGAIGGVLADVDTLDNDYHADALIGELLAFGTLGIVFVLDHFFKWGICNSIIADRNQSILGFIGVVVLWIIGFKQNHRKFTHSILATFLYPISLGMIYRPLAWVCFVGYISHLILDLLNKKGIQLFFPLKSTFCLYLCYAGKIANKVFMWLGFIATIVLFIYRVLVIMSLI